MAKVVTSTAMEEEFFRSALDAQLNRQFDVAFKLYRIIGLNDYADMVISHGNLEFIFMYVKEMSAARDVDDLELEQVHKRYREIISYTIEEIYKNKKNPFLNLVSAVIACKDMPDFSDELRSHYIEHAFQMIENFEPVISNVMAAWCNYINAYINIYAHTEIRLVRRFMEVAYQFPLNKSVPLYLDTCADFHFKAVSTAIYNAKLIDIGQNNGLLRSLIEQAGIYINNYTGKHTKNLPNFTDLERKELRVLHGLCQTAMHVDAEDLQDFVETISNRMIDCSLKVLGNVRALDAAGSVRLHASLFPQGSIFKEQAYLQYGSIGSHVLTASYPEINLFHMESFHILNDRGEVSVGNKLLTDFAISIFIDDEERVSPLNAFAGRWIGGQHAAKVAMHCNKYSVVIVPKATAALNSDDDFVLFVDSSNLNNHAHWLLDALPRILKSMDSVAPDIKLAFLQPLTAYQLDTLSFAGLPYDRVCIVQQNKYPIKVNKAYVSGPNWCSSIGVGADYAALHPDAVRAVRAALYKDNFGRPAKGKRLFISRTRDDHATGSRVISNEKEIMPILERHGVERVDVVPLSFEQQRELFYDTDLLISAAGAAQANMIFMREGSTVISFINDVYSGTMYQIMADILGINLIAIYSKTELFTLSNDVRIDADDLLFALESVI